MKNKIIIKPREEVIKWIIISNLFAKSRLSAEEALRQFNSLTSLQRRNIKKTFENCDKIRLKKIPEGERDSAWEISVMVDAHIIATEYDIDPLTVMMCISPICKQNERVVLK